MSLFTALIQDMVEKKHLLTEHDIGMLQILVPAPPAPLIQPEEVAEDESSEPLSISALLKKLTRTADRLYRVATMSDDAADLKVAASTLRQVMDIAIKHADKINAADRALKIENALVEAVDELDRSHSGFKDMFLRYLSQSLETRS